MLMICGGRKRFTNFNELQTPPLLIEQFVEPCILLCILQEPRHGYAIMQYLKETCLCEAIDAGNFYRVLGKLKNENLIAAQKDGRKFIYHITAHGKVFLSGWKTTLEKNKAVLAAYLQKYEEVAHV